MRWGSRSDSGTDPGIWFRGEFRIESWASWFLNRNCCYILSASNHIHGAKSQSLPSFLILCSLNHLITQFFGLDLHLLLYSVTTLHIAELAISGCVLLGQQIHQWKEIRVSFQFHGWVNNLVLTHRCRSHYCPHVFTVHMFFHYSHHISFILVY